MITIRHITPLSWFTALSDAYLYHILSRGYFYRRWKNRANLFVPFLSFSLSVASAKIFDPPRRRDTRNLSFWYPGACYANGRVNFRPSPPRRKLTFRSNRNFCWSGFYVGACCRVETLWSSYIEYPSTLASNSIIAHRYLYFYISLTLINFLCMFLKIFAIKLNK